MDNWESRLKEETFRMAGKVNDLSDFMRTRRFYELPRIEKDLFYDQQHTMLMYLQVLGKQCEIYGIKLYDDIKSDDKTKK